MARDARTVSAAPGGNHDGRVVAGEGCWRDLYGYSEQPGLKLEAMKEPIEILVIDHVERAPENEGGTLSQAVRLVKCFGANGSDSCGSSHRRC
jgi:hypothetical protein